MLFEREDGVAFFQMIKKIEEKVYKGLIRY